MGLEQDFNSLSFPRSTYSVVAPYAANIATPGQGTVRFTDFDA